MKQWKCTVCGYVHTGEEPPDTCPVCGADKSRFVLLEETAATESPETPGAPVGSSASGLEMLDSSEEQPQAQTAQSEPPPEDESKQSATAKQNIPPPAWKRFPGSVYGQNLTRYHGHPIAVHIPNGVLPVGVFFTLLAAIFKSETLSIAAQYDIGFVALTMPLVIGTGLNDWVNSFKARITRVFKIKMVCAAIVTVLSILLALWGMVRPGIYLSGFSEGWFFLLLHIANLAVATVAGWYGGKLVFHR
jgi:rubredoxin/uncharacterized membrane protein